MIILLCMTIGVIIAYFLQLAFFSFYSRKGISGDMSIVEDGIPLGGTAHLKVSVINRKKLPISAIGVSFRTDKGLAIDKGQNQVVSDYVHHRDILSVGGYEKVAKVMDIVGKKRGFYGFYELMLETSDLFFSRSYKHIQKCNTGIYVYPERVNTALISSAARRIMGQIELERQLTEDPFIFSGIREYQRYDSFGNVNWKASARNSRLMVNQKGYSTDMNIMILLDLTESGNGENRDLLEKSISVCDALAELFIRSGIGVGIQTNGSDHRFGREIKIEGGTSNAHMMMIRKLLSEARYSCEAGSFDEVLEANTGNAGNSGRSYVVISGSHAESAALSQLCRKQDVNLIQMKMTGSDCERVIPGGTKVQVWEVPYA